MPNVVGRGVPPQPETAVVVTEDPVSSKPTWKNASPKKKTKKERQVQSESAAPPPVPMPAPMPYAAPHEHPQSWISWRRQSRSCALVLMNHADFLVTYSQPNAPTITTPTVTSLF